MHSLPPLSLYVHFPWCIKKCPYCDFNSHQANNELPEVAYIQQLIANLKRNAPFIQKRPIHSIFIGGGTPSLISPQAIKQLLDGIDQQWGIPKGCEITLEANPGATDSKNLQGFYQAGVNRLSIGVQSFQAQHLKKLGRIHDAQAARDAAASAHQAGFQHMNIDLMFGLPEQSISQALSDIKEAINCQPDHLSWYQLTIEPQTAFYHQPPPLPTDDLIWEMVGEGQRLLAESGFHPYEVSAYAKEHRCKHNLNYWNYGDYLGIGAGAHSKITQRDGSIMRFSQARSPQRYLQLTDFNEQHEKPTPEQIRMEYMMNRLRLLDPISLEHFHLTTSLSPEALADGIQQGMERGWLEASNDKVSVTDLGRRYLNDLIVLF